MPKPVVAGLDGSRESMAAAHWAAREALRRGLPLRLVQAWEGPPEDDTGLRPSGPGSPRDHAHQVLRRALVRINEWHPRLYVAAEQVTTAPAAALSAEAEKAELLVIGSQGFGAVGGLVAGSVALATVGHARCPVVLVRAGEKAEDEHLPDAAGKPATHTAFRDVAVAVDTGGPCDDVLEFAFRAAELRRAPLRAVHAWHVPPGRGVVDAEERARLRRAAQRELAAVLEPWHRKFPAVFVREELHEGFPAHVLERAARGAGLLVLGRRTRRSPIGSRTGPVAHALIHHVGRPVVIVPHG
ncbi:stress-inducible protein [Streptomyces toyocaensis]|uniref:Stress-inducible protein n=1 Tax=Streptomyces toyocaensis TaxID=55952 RepID=A0A081XL98_STRTO|nr:stress-inducible protein [Streptomyces toyocaensis]